MRRGIGWAFLLGSALCLARAPASSAQTQAARLATFTVSAVDREGGTALSKGDVRLFVAGKERPVESLATSDALPLALLIDDSVAQGGADQWNELRQFIQAQPATTQIAVAYLRDNVATLARDFTTDRALAAAALRAPQGVGGRSSPYLATLDLLRRWPESGPRRSILLISPGVDFRRGERASIALPEVEPLVARAQALNTNVWAVFYPGGGHRGRNFTHVKNGQENLARLAEATGGELFVSGPGAPGSLRPYLDEVSAHLGSQQLPSFAPARGESGRHVVDDVRTQVQGVQLLAPSAVYVY